MGGQKKEYRPFGVFGGEGRTVLAASIIAFAEADVADVVVVVTPPGGEAQARAALPARLMAPDAVPPIVFVQGGSSRRQSVHNALRALPRGRFDFVHIHDGARPWVSADLIARLDAAVRRDRAVIPVMPLVETPKEISSDGAVARHLKRAAVVSAQTPQSFEFDSILSAHEQAAEAEAAGIEYTDDAEVWAAFIGPVRTVPGQAANKKITFPEDLPPEGAGS
jgi:2-C-methyl-D-erythritol 4-phosphate cytidylyltransferase